MPSLTWDANIAWYPGTGVYQKRQTTIIGLKGKPGAQGTGGVRMLLKASGDAITTGEGKLILELSKATHIRSQLINLQVTNGTGNNAGGSVNLRSDSASIAINPTSSLFKPEHYLDGKAKQSLVNAVVKVLQPEGSDHQHFCGHTTIWTN